MSNLAARRSSAAASQEWRQAQQTGTGRDETGTMDSTHHSQPAAPARLRRRRPRQPFKRPHTIRFALTDEEFSQVAAAADQAGLAKGAFAAQSTLAIARNGTTPSDSPLREALGALIRAAGLVRRIGVNLNQAVAKLNATGQRSGDLLPYAAESIRRAQLLDQAAEEVRKRIRQ
jgi:hypothetical protein